ncbi:MAG: lysophospholipid acyltransferase family protein [Candidatus Limnocylindria bacterium]
MLPIALRTAELLTRLLPAGTQYALADFAGDLWYRLAPRRRRLVRANLARACGGVDAAVVRQAFREHARYYLEILRVPRYAADRIASHVSVVGWDVIEPIFHGGPVVLVTAHLGNFEPMGHWLAAYRLRVVAPVEEIRPRALFDFLLARRGGGRGALEVIPLSSARHRLVAALKAGDAIALVADRDLEGNGLRMPLFGHATTIPMGPAALALLTGARLITGRSLRIGPDRFEIRGEVLEWQPSGDRRADVAALTARIAARLESYIRERPEQWFGAFQQIWPDLAA